MINMLLFRIFMIDTACACLIPGRAVTNGNSSAHKVFKSLKETKPLRNIGENWVTGIEMKCQECARDKGLGIRCNLATLPLTSLARFSCVIHAVPVSIMSYLYMWPILRECAPRFYSSNTILFLSLSTST